MRLVDADALREHYNVIDPAGTFAYCDSILTCIDNAPTIDAIPVEWLKNRRDIYLKAYHAGHESELRTAAILNDTMQAWQKEQEAQDE